MKSQNQTSQLTITREFNAPKEFIFNAFAEANAMGKWWGPPGFPIEVVKFDFRPNGVFHYKADMQGQSSWGRFIYGKIVKPDLLEFTSSFSDEKGGVTRAPFSDKFPLQIFNRVELAEKNGNTVLTLSGHPVNATDEEIEFFNSISAGMQQGFAGTFDQLETYLSSKK